MTGIRAGLAGKKAGLAITGLIVVNAYLLSRSFTDSHAITKLQSQLDEAVRIFQAELALQEREINALKGSSLRRDPVSEPTTATTSVVSKTSSTDMLRPLGGPNGLADRLGRLEAITKGRLNWIREPYVGHRVAHECGKQEQIDEHYVCYDHFPPPRDRAEPCVIYDMGIREQPGFGKKLAEKYPECEVHAFDPSPIAIAYQKSEDPEAKALRALKNYHFHPYGSGGVDGHVTLYNYNWGQVSTIRVPHYVTNDCGYNDEQDLADLNIKRDTKLRYHEKRCRTIDNMAIAEGVRGGFGDTAIQLEVHTLKTIMADLGHTHVDILKLDVEGSEFAFLESALDDFDCPPVEQMSIEWHHYNHDTRYGGGASPEVNAIATYLHDRCAIKQYQIEMDNGGWEDNFQWLKDAYLSLRFNTGSYMRAR